MNEAMNELAWRRREQELAGKHAAADPPLSPAIWHGVETALAGPPRRGVWLALGAVVLAAAGVVLWLTPHPRAAELRPVGEVSALAPPTVPPVGSATGPTTGSATAPALAQPKVPPAGSVTGAVPSSSPVLGAGSAGPSQVLNRVVEPAAAVTFVIASDAGRIELEPCRGRFVNVTVLDSPHRQLDLVVHGRRIEASFDGGAAMASGVAHILVPADTHIVVSTRTGAVIVRGLGGPMEIETQSGELRIDTAPQLAPSVTATSDSGAITWRGRCGLGCRIEARSASGDITLRAPDPAAFTRGAVRGESRAGRVHLEELTCTEPRCSSSPLPWRQAAAVPH